jgi:hypothetical protein
MTAKRGVYSACAFDHVHIVAAMMRKLPPSLMSGALMTARVIRTRHTRTAMTVEVMTDVRGRVRRQKSQPDVVRRRQNRVIGGEIV